MISNATIRAVGQTKKKRGEIMEQCSFKWDGETLTYAEAFAKFDRENPHVYERLKAEALSFRRTTGVKHVGMDLIIARLRWLHAFETKGDTFKLNNNFKSYYARKLMRNVPELAGLFRVREQRAKNKIMPRAELSEV